MTNSKFNQRLFGKKNKRHHLTPRENKPLCSVTCVTGIFAQSNSNGIDEHSQFNVNYYYHLGLEKRDHDPIPMLLKMCSVCSFHENKIRSQNGGRNSAHVVNGIYVYAVGEPC